MPPPTSPSVARTCLSRVTYTYQTLTAAVLIPFTRQVSFPKAYLLDSQPQECPQAGHLSRPGTLMPSHPVTDRG